MPMRRADRAQVHPPIGTIDTNDGIEVGFVGGAAILSSRDALGDQVDRDLGQSSARVRHPCRQTQPFQ